MPRKRSTGQASFLPLFEQEIVSVVVEQPGGVAPYRAAVPLTPSQVWRIDFSGSCRGDMIAGVYLDELQVPYVVVFAIEGRF